MVLFYLLLSIKGYLLCCSHAQLCCAWPIRIPFLALLMNWFVTGFLIMDHEERRHHSLKKKKKSKKKSKDNSEEKRSRHSQVVSDLSDSEPEQGEIDDTEGEMSENDFLPAMANESSSEASPEFEKRKKKKKEKKKHKHSSSKKHRKKKRRRSRSSSLDYMDEPPVIVRPPDYVAYDRGRTFPGRPRSSSGRYPDYKYRRSPPYSSRYSPPYSPHTPPLPPKAYEKLAPSKIEQILKRPSSRSSSPGERYRQRRKFDRSRSPIGTPSKKKRRSRSRSRELRKDRSPLRCVLFNTLCKGTQNLLL